MNTPGGHDALLPLLEGLCNEELTDEQLARLQELLRNDEAAQRLYFAYVDVHLGLRHISGVESPESGSDRDLSRAAAGGRWRRYLVRTARPVLAATLLTAIVAVGVLFRFTLSRPAPARPSPSVTIKHVWGNVVIRGTGGQRRPAAAGLAVVPGENIRTFGVESLVVLVYSDSTELLIAGVSEVALRAADQLVVNVGTISASVATQRPDRPLTINTPQAQIEVLGTDFELSAADQYTDLQVSEGRVKLTRASDGRSVVVGEGERVVASAATDLSVREAPPPPDTWFVDFEDGLPDGWRDGRLVTEELVAEGLPPGSHGAVRAELSAETGIFSISSPTAWMDGLFVVHSDSHLRVVLRMDAPDWINMFFITRTSDARDPVTFLHRFNELPLNLERGAWWEVTIPLSRFQRKTGGQFGSTPPKSGELAFGMSWSAPEPDRGLIVDRVAVTRGGPGEVVIRKVERPE